MTIKIFNTLTRQKEVFETIDPGRVRMYVCGPTVYSTAHIGHAMSALVFDIIRRYLEYRGYEVRFVMNYTDVDDKIIKRANEEKIDPRVLAERYIQEYRQNLADLNVLPATVNPRATQDMPQIIAMVQGLIERGYAYRANGDVYFRITRDTDYGKLSGRQIEDMQAGARIEIGEHKEHPMDFALWKAAKPGEPAWESPWGAGRPGWHIECSAMNLKHLGEQIDIHGGGNDLIFPHHENEIAQTESLTNKPFSRYWIHNGMLQLSGEKMSKSLGNLVSIDDFLGEHEADALRMLVLTSNYRSPLSYSPEIVAQTERTLERLRSAMRPALSESGTAPAVAIQALENQVSAAQENFLAAMDDDFNTPVAISALFELVRAINQARDGGVDAQNLQKAQAILVELAEVLGLNMQPPEKKSQEVDPFIQLLIDIRKELRSQKMWALADQLRNRLLELGVLLEDSKEGTTWRWK